MKPQEHRDMEQATPSPLVMALAAIDNQILEAAPDAVVIIDAGGQIVLVNHQTEVLFDYQRVDLIGQHLHRLLPERFHATHTQQRERYFAEPRTRPMGMHRDLFGRRRDGSEFPVAISLSPLQTSAGVGAISIIRDVTTEHRLRAALEESERQAHVRALAADAQRSLLQVILDEMPSGIYLVRGATARLVLANRAAHAVWGAIWPVGQSMRDFLATSGTRILAVNGHVLREDELATIRTVQTGQPILQQHEVIRHPDGVTLPILVSTSPVTAQVATASLVDAASEGRDAEPVAVVVLQDVTALQEAERLKDEFVGIAAHELRTPLAALKGYADMLTTHSARGKGVALADWQVEAIAALDQAASRLVALTDDLLDVTRLQSGRLTLHRAPSDLGAITQRVVQRAQITTQQHTFAVLTAPAIILQLDALRIEQVISNLVNNAVKYSPAGGTITIRLQVDPAQNQALWSIHDPGIGIPVEQHAQIFNRFARADNTQDYGITGTGLGLYLCRELIERHDGHIWFESAAQHGATFFFTLPLTGMADPADDDVSVTTATA